MGMIGGPKKNQGKCREDPPTQHDNLRRQAETLLEAEDTPPEELAPDQAARLIHELRVHQIELQLQNEELRAAQAGLEESRSRYADLYDFAPVGYLTVDQQGRVLKANFTAATLLGVRARQADKPPLSPAPGATGPPGLPPTPQQRPQA